ncbi:predicted protein [Botrytis cinerea T4]|uniref:Uncharacterized protein n=1 Tax=Botryotinia fuckeliana (strain T4) TaxID=999810 RepID=G2YYC1_BOTF4|nr:predicted protein [Botrytis cinerea T4]
MHCTNQPEITDYAPSKHIPKFDGPCQRCVVRGLPCRMLNPNSKIAEFTRPSRCALCIVDHEASLPLFTGNIPLLWGPFGLEIPTPASVERSEKESPTFIPSPLENKVTTQCPLDSAEVQERLEAIHR